MSQPPFRSAAQVRRDFIDYFVKNAGHVFVPSSPVVPHEDPTLLFTNAGMNQFKDVFLGTGTRNYQRAVNSQKCIRAGGKHNDLEDVGKDTYHHTFFEMLGNWSFGDYFKADAIEWAWDLLTNFWGLPKDRLHATYFQGDPAENLAPDHEARDLWRRYLPDSQIHPGNKKDNFWEMGESGPCGPCSEIHFDQTPSKNGASLVNASDPRVIEIWNLVFIQFNRDADSKLSPLPAKHVDTGMGFERITRILQGKDSNYETDIWTPIFLAIEQFTGAQPYRGKLEDHIDIAYRVIADHIRCLTLAITDGSRPSNEGRGYVLRRILRRAVRHAHQTLHVNGPMLHKLVNSVVQSLGDAFPEIKKNPQQVSDVIREEEEAFLKTLDRGIELFEIAAQGKAVSAEAAFKLHDTYGFPIDLTRVMAEERGMTVDLDGFERLMEEARQTSRGKSGKSAEEVISLPPDAMARLKHMGVKPTEDIDKYHGRPLMAEVKAIWNGSNFDDAAVHGLPVAIILDRTTFYAESGGQVSDTGDLYEEYDPASAPLRNRGQGGRRTGTARFEVEDTRAIGSPGGSFVLHIGRMHEGRLNVGDRVTVEIDAHRRTSIRANHSATHMLNLALRQTLGLEIEQKGSLVAPDRLRFDFSHHQSLTPHQVDDVQRLVNELIEEDLQVHIDILPLAKARGIKGVRAVFGEKYPDPVRVVSIGAPFDQLLAEPANEQWMDFSIEFCGGTHLDRTTAAERFVILSEQALASGVRRIVALTGPAAMAANVAGMELVGRIEAAAQLDDDRLPQEVQEIASLSESLTLGLTARHRVQDLLVPLRERVKKIRKGAEQFGREAVVAEARMLADSTNTAVIVSSIAAGNRDMLLVALDTVCARRPGSAVMLLTADVIEPKVYMAARVPKDFITRGLKAGDWVKAAAMACGGSGGGKPDSAQAGGKDPAKLPDAIHAAWTFAQEMAGPAASSTERTARPS